MTFLYPDVLYLLILPLLLAVVACILWKRRSKRWELLVCPAYKDNLVEAPSTWHRTLPVVFGVLAAIFSILSMARPFDGFSEREEMPKSRNILIAIDCSRSMLCKDVSPSRLERAKTAAYDLLDALPADNFGIIIFSGNAVLLMPLTYDHEALKETIEQLKFGWVSHGGSNLDSAVSLALQTFKRDKKKDAMDALVILSDGEDTINVSPKLASEAKQNNLILITAGIGTTSGTTIPDEKHPSGLYHDYKGKTVISKLSPDNLQNLASMTGGQYVQLSDGASLNAFVKETANKLEANQNDSVKTRIPNDRFYIFAIPALVCLLLTLIASTKWRSITHIFGSKSVSSIIILASFLGIFIASPAHATDDITDNIISLIRQNNHEEAIKAIDSALRNPSLSDDKRHALHYAKGYIARINNQAQETAEALSEALLSNSTNLQSDTHCNLGNLSGDVVNKKMTFKSNSSLSSASQIQAPLSIDEKIKEIDKRLKAINETKPHLKEAFSHFDDALNTNPNHQEALANKSKLANYSKQLDDYRKELEKLKKQLEEEKKKQQQQQQQQNNENQDQSDNKNNQDKSDQNKKQDNKKSSDKNQQNDKNNKKDSDKDKQNKNQNKNKDKDKDKDQNKDKDQDKENKDKPNPDEKNNQEQNKPKDDPSKDDEMKNARPEEKKDEQEKPQKAPDKPLNNPNKDLLSVKRQQQAQTDKELKEARDILKDRRDQEEGCPVPQPIQFLPPKKDY